MTSEKYMTVDEMIEVLVAAKAGAKIEIYDPSEPEEGWVEIQEPGWNFIDFLYRIKQE